MMEEAAELGNYLPLFFKSPEEQEYIEFLWDAFETNYTNDKYQFAFLAYHMLTMSVVYFNIWQIRQMRPDDFRTALIGFDKEVENALLAATSPFSFCHEKLKERTMLRLLKLIACGNDKIGTYAKLVDDRNQTAHSNGKILFSSRDELDAKINRTLCAVADIQAHLKQVIQHCYREFLVRSANPEEREYPGPVEQIQEALIHDNYLSQKDIDFCLEFDLESLKEATNFGEMKELHDALARYNLEG